MTNKERENIIRVCGVEYKYRDIPAYIRRRDNYSYKEWKECAERILQVNILQELRKMKYIFNEVFEEEKEDIFSEENPIGGTIDNYDIEREKEILY